jgi:hypothetical protein
MKKLIFISASLIMVMTSCNQKSKLSSSNLSERIDINTKNVLQVVRDYKFSVDSLRYINKLDSASASLLNERCSKKMADLIIDNAKINADILNSDLDGKTSGPLLDRVHEIGLASSYYLEYEERDKVADGLNAALNSIVIK